MMTLTLDPKMFLNLGLEYVKLSPAWNRLKTALNWSYGKFEYVRVVAAQKMGLPHLHVQIKFHEWRGYYNRKVNGKRVQYMCEKPFIPQDHLAELWRNAVGGNGTAYVTSCTDNVNTVWYVVKYVRKSIAELWYGLFFCV
jgi:hypothetical protein